MNLNSYLDFVSLAEQVPLRAVASPSMPVRRDTGELGELVSSIRSVGLVHPILIRPISDSRFEVVAGMRRVEACRILHWTHIPAIIRDMNAEEAYEVALAENIQRKSMDPIEEASAFETYANRAGWGGISRLAEKLGKSKSYVSQRISLLSLPTAVQQQLRSGQLTPSVARELINLGSAESQEEAARNAAGLKLSSRSAKQLLRFEPLGSATGSLASISLDHSIDVTLPEFMKYPLPSKKKDVSIRALQQAILAMKLTLARIDILKEKCSHDPDTSEYLQKLRFTIHSMIDECIRKKMEAVRSTKSGSY